MICVWPRSPDTICYPVFLSLLKRHLLQGESGPGYRRVICFYPNGGASMEASLSCRFCNYMKQLATNFTEVLATRP